MLKMMVRARTLEKYDVLVALVNFGILLEQSFISE
jgi:hypothetical protein